MVTPSLPVLQGLISLAEFLITQCDIMDDPEAEDKRRKLVHDCIPDSITDGPALARELSWRVRRELAAGATCSVDSTGVPASGKKSALSLPRKKSRLWLLNTTYAAKVTELIVVRGKSRRHLQPKTPSWSCCHAPMVKIVK